MLNTPANSINPGRPVQSSQSFPADQFPPCERTWLPNDPVGS